MSQGKHEKRRWRVEIPDFQFHGPERTVRIVTVCPHDRRYSFLVRDATEIIRTVDEFRCADNCSLLRELALADYRR